MAHFLRRRRRETRLLGGALEQADLLVNVLQKYACSTRTQCEHEIFLMRIYVYSTVE